MVVGRDLAAVVGVLLIMVAGWSVIGTVVVPRRIRSKLTRAVSITVDTVFHYLADRFDSYEPRDRILAAQAPIQLILFIVVWLAVFELGFALLLWPSAGAAGLPGAFQLAGSSLCTLGYLAPHGGAPRGVVDLAALIGLGTVALQIGYLPTLYAAFNRREALVTMLDSRAGVPSWGPELLARTHYGLGSGVSAVSELPALFEDWERWSADVSESHATYLALLNFRSPRPLSICRCCPMLRVRCQPDFACEEGSPASGPLRVPAVSPSPKRRIRTTASLSPTRNSSTQSTAWRWWTFPSSARARRPGSTSWVGGSTTSRRPTPSPVPSTPHRRCGRGLAGIRFPPSHPFGRLPDGRLRRPRRPPTERGRPLRKGPVTGSQPGLSRRGSPANGARRAAARSVVR